MKPEELHGEINERAIPRRKMLKRIGAGAAIAWTAPVLTSLRTPAFAQYRLCNDGPGVGCAVGGDDCLGQVACGPAGSPCGCVRTTSGTCFCHAFSFCANVTPCTSSSQCPPDFACAHSCCDPSLGSAACLPSCAHGGLTTAGAGATTNPS